MKLFPVADIKKIDTKTITYEPVASIDLMERAALACTKWISDKFPPVKPVVVFAGPGNNGGDGLAIARLLSKNYYKVLVIVPELNRKCSDDFTENMNRLKSMDSVSIQSIGDTNDFPTLEPDCLIIDALFGSGLNRPLSGIAETLIQFINDLGQTVVSIDLPSGLFGEDNSLNHPKSIIRADFTLSFQFPKLSFFFSSNESFVGNWEILDIGLHARAIEETPSKWNYLDRDEAESPEKKIPVFPQRPLWPCLNHCRQQGDDGCSHSFLTCLSAGRMRSGDCACSSRHRSNPSCHCTGITYQY